MYRIFACLTVCVVLLGCSKPGDDTPMATQPMETSPMAEQGSETSLAPSEPTATTDDHQLDASQPPADSAAAHGTVKGVTVDGRGGGVEETVISIYRSDDAEPLATTTTKPDGSFVLDAVPVGEEFIVRAVKPKSLLGVRGEKRHVAVSADEETDVGNIELMIPGKSD
jgi:hypothetical protein